MRVFTRKLPILALSLFFTLETCAVRENGFLPELILILSLKQFSTAPTLGGTITGLRDTGLVLSSGTNPNQTLTVAANSTSFSFPNSISKGSAYNVTATSLPNFRNCIISNGSGTFADNTNSVTVTCNYLLGGNIIGLPLDLKGIVTTPYSSGFNQPSGITTDGANLYVADINSNSIKKIVISTNQVTTLASSVGSPFGITTDGENLFVSSYLGDKIRKINISTSQVTTVTGGSQGDSDGNGTSAQFNAPIGITLTGGNLYICDAANDKIKRFTISNSQVTTFAGDSPGGSSAIDGIGKAARFNALRHLTTDETNLYIADSGNYKIRKIVISTSQVTTFAGDSTGGSDIDGIGIAARFDAPYGIATDGTNLYVSDIGGNHSIRKIVINTGVVTTLAGGLTSGTTDGIGTTAKFNEPRHLTTDGKYLYIADRINNSIRRIE